MTAKIIDGKMVASLRTEMVRNEVEHRIKQGLKQPALAVIIVGENPASKVYVRNKKLACEKTNIQSVSYELPKETTQEELLALIDHLNNDKNVDGIIVQLPIPDHINPQTIIDRLDPKKDVDGFHPYNMGCLVIKRPILRPCTPLGVMTLLEHYQLDPKGKKAIVIGASNIVGRPQTLELLLAQATVTVCHTQTHHLEKEISKADIIVAGIGRPNFVQGEWIKPGAIVIDVGINRLPDGKLCGDVDFHSAKERASWITPVPGGVGPMTVATLLENTLKATMLRSKE